MSNYNIYEDISLPSLLQNCALVTAIRRGGKSYFLRGLMETFSGKVQQIVFDPEGEFISLRPHFPFALAAVEGGDIPLSVEYADILARKIMESRISIIIDLYGLKLDQRLKFAELFFRSLMNLKKELYHDCLVYIDEAQLFCSQDDPSPCGSEIIDTITRGGKRGIGMVLSTLRLAGVDKKATTQCQNKFIGINTDHNDLVRCCKEMGLPPKDGVKFRALKQGHFYGYGPALSPSEPFEFLVPTAKTKAVKMGTVGYVAPAAPEQLKDVFAMFADLPDEAAKELATIEQLKSEVARLKVKLNLLPTDHEISTNAKAAKQLDQLRMERDEYKDAWHEGQKNLVAAAVQIDKQRKVIIQVMDTARDYLEAEKVVVHVAPPPISDVEFEEPGVNAGVWVEEIGRTPANPSPELVDMKGVDEHGEFTQTNMDYGHGMVARGPREYSGIKRVKTQFLDGVVITETLRDDGPTPMYIPSLPDKLGRCERNVLEFLAAHGQEFTKYQIATGTGYTQTSGGFKNALSALASANLILRSPSGIRANWPAMSSAIINFVGPVFDKKVSAATYADKLGKCERTVLEFLVKHPGTAYTKSEIAEINGYSVTSGGFKNALSCLASLGMIDRTLVGIRLMPGLPVK